VAGDRNGVFSNAIIEFLSRNVFARDLGSEPHS
jgi:hypothetical protein